MSNELNRHINILNIEVRLKLVAAPPLSFVFILSLSPPCVATLYVTTGSGSDVGPTKKNEKDNIIC